MNDRNGIMVQARARSSSAPHTFTAVAPSTDAINPLEYPVRQDEDVDFGALPFACPAAQRVLPIGSGPGGARMFLLAGDEYAVLYAVTPRPPSSPKAAAAAGGGVAKGGVGKKRRSSASGRSVPTDGESGLVRPVWRVRQGYGTVVA
jgi:DNA damage-binding protein 1